MNQLSSEKFSDAGIQDISTSISIKLRIQKNLNDLIERCESHDDDDDDESDKHLEARDRRYSYLKVVSQNYCEDHCILWCYLICDPSPTLRNSDN